MAAPFNGFNMPREAILELVEIHNYLMRLADRGDLHPVIARRCGALIEWIIHIGRHPFNEFRFLTMMALYHSLNDVLEIFFPPDD